MENPLIINLALTGMVPTKEQTPHVPLSVDEILEDVALCSQAGASIIHVHARDNGRPTHRADAFEPLVEGIRGIDPSLVVCVTCSGRHVSELDLRAEVLDLTGAAKPDMGSLTLGSNNFRTQASVNPPDVIEGLAERMLARGIKPELEVFEPGMLTAVHRLVRRGLIEAPCYVNVLLGNPGTAPLSPALIAAFDSLLPDDWLWAFGGIGRWQLDATLAAIALGGHVRTGLEDNIWADRGRTQLATNVELVRRIARAADLADRPLATPRETRALLGISPADAAAA